MNHKFIPVIFISTALLFLMACTKNESYTEAGGNLPTHYLTVLPGGQLQPANISIASGASITFVNTHNKPHRFLSLDADSSIYTPVIAPDSSYFFKNDTLIGVFAFKCVLDSSITGSIIIRP